MQPDISSEIEFRTARSGGSGGQHVNKVETMVEGRWKISASALVPEDRKELLYQKLANRITSEGYLLVKSQVERTQLGNKLLVIKKMNELVRKTLVKKKARIATRPSRASRERRIESKRSRSAIKEGRKPWKPGND